ncbi:MAG: RagB/SusD family nutrient uptake outer membrane protein [Gemmatimonadetes bacterium]|nr:RagB/SusD family nutrient uptake outer membrane protein [Gemmatimonadota bacterium]
MTTRSPSYRTEPTTMPSRLQRRLTRAAALVLLAGLAACDTRVVNPGRINDQYLQDPGAQPAIVNGAGRALASGINWVGYTGAAVAREIHPAGSTGSFGITPQWQKGVLDPEDRDLNDHWEQTQRGRWTAEHAAAVVEAAPLNDTLLARAYIYAGFANRVLGDNMCDAVIDGGPKQPNSAYWTRAEEYFTKAMSHGTATQKLQAQAGRAQARVWLGKWSEAVADAKAIPTSFSYAIPYYNIGEDAQRNRIQWSVGNGPYRAHTQWNTWVEKYYADTQDPRVPYSKPLDKDGNPMLGDAAIECCGKVLWYPQQKYKTPDAPIRLASGHEMRLIEAEAKLRDGDFTGALALINEVRADAGAPPVTASTLVDTWTLLKRERAIELWLEARRLGDLRRWKADNTPGALDPLEQVGPQSHLTQQDLCFPIAPSEKDTNPNLQP